MWFEAILPDGICVLGGGKYSATVKLSDINYQMATEDRQRTLLEQYAKFFNGFAAGEQLQVTIINRRVDRDTLLSRVLYPEPRHGDQVSKFRADHNQIVRNKIGADKYLIVAEKYLTLTVTAENNEDAAAHLDRLVESVINHMWSLLECQAYRVDGPARVQLLREITRGCYASDAVDYPSMGLSGATTRDEIAPAAVDLRNSSRIVITGDAEDRWCETVVMRNYPSWMSDDLFKKLSAIQTDMVISFHVDPIDRSDSQDLVQSSLMKIGMEVQDSRKKLRKAGMDPEFDLPHVLTRSRTEVEELLADIEKSDQRLFTTTMVILVMAPSETELGRRVAQVRQVAKGESCELMGLKFFQAQGFNTALPLGESWLPIHRTLTTAAVAVMVPFTSQEVLGDEGFFYGLNTASKNPIIANPLSTRNGNAFVLGTSGSGKSHITKWLAVEVLLGRANDDVIIIDPEREYRPLAATFAATQVEIHAGSTQIVNPFDLVMSSAEGDPVRLKATALLGMLDVLLGGNVGLVATQRSILDRAITTVYARYLEGGAVSGSTPTFATLHTELLAQPEPDAHQLATALELYARGSFSGFSQQTNVDTSARFINYDLSLLGEHMKVFGMMVVLDQIWNRVLNNFGSGRRTWLFIDEFQLMISNPVAMEALRNFYARARKYGLMPISITQNAELVLSVPAARIMIANCDTLILMGQQKNDADELAALLDLSEEQIRAFTNVEPGCGLLRFGATTLGFNGRKPTDGPLAALFNTQFEG